MRHIVSAVKAPKAVGPYSLAVKANGFIFVSGQLAIDPSSGLLIEGDAVLQAELAIENLKAILEEAGSSLAKAVKATIFLKNMNDFTRVNEVYGRYFHTAPPARSTVEVACLPKDAQIEIDLIALE